MKIQARGAVKRSRQMYSMIKANPAAVSATMSFCRRFTCASGQKKMCLVASTSAWHVTDENTLEDFWNALP
jgi:hypothetical protein